MGKREDAIKAMADYLDLLGVARRYAKSVINKVPSAEKQGEWIDIPRKMFKCSECGQTYQVLEPKNFCSNCGARMK